MEILLTKMRIEIYTDAPHILITLYDINISCGE